MLKPSGSSASSIRRASRRAATIVRSRSSSEISIRSALCSRGTTSAWPRVAGIDVHEGDRVLVGVDDLRRARRRRRSRRRGSHRPSRRQLIVGADSASIAGQPPRASSRLADLAREHGRLDLGEQPAELGPGSMPSSAASSSPRTSGRGGPPRRQASAAAEHLAGQLEVGLDHLLARDRALAAGREPVGDREQGDVGASPARSRAGSRRSGAALSGRSWTRNPSRRWCRVRSWRWRRRRPARAQPPAHLGDDRGALAVVADEGDAAALAPARVCGLPKSWTRAPKRSAPPRVSPSASGSASSSRDRRPRSPGEALEVALDLEQPPQAPRACGRGRRGGGWGSARRRAAPRARAAPRR